MNTVAKYPGRRISNCTMIVHGFPGQGKRWEAKDDSEAEASRTFSRPKQDIHKGMWYTDLTTR